MRGRPVVPGRLPASPKARTASLRLDHADSVGVVICGLRLGGSDPVVRRVGAAGGRSDRQVVEVDAKVERPVGLDETDGGSSGFPAEFVSLADGCFGAGHVSSSRRSLAPTPSGYYQFTAIDDCTRVRVLRIYPPAQPNDGYPLRRRRP